MRRSLVGAAFLLVVMSLFGCDSGVVELEPDNAIGLDSDSGPEAVEILDSSGAEDLVELVKPERLGAHVDPAFEGWLDVGGLAPAVLAIHPEGHSVLVTVDYLSVLYDLRSGQELKSWPGRFSVASFSGNGKRLVTLGSDPTGPYASPGGPKTSIPHRSAAVWDTETGAEICRIRPSRRAWDRRIYGAANNALALNHDGTQVAVSNYCDSFDPRLPHGVLLFDAESGRLRTALPMPLAAQFHMTFVANGTRLLVECSAWRHKGPRGQSPWRVDVGTLWDTQTGELLHTFPDEATVCVSPDGRWIATGWAVKRNHRADRPEGRDTTTLTIRDAVTGEPVQDLKHERDLRDFAFSPDSERVLVSVEGRLVEWDWRSGERPYESETKKPYARVYYSPDGRRRFALTEELSDVDDDLVYRLRGWTIATGDELPIAGYEMSYNSIDELFFFPHSDRFIKLNYGRNDFWGERYLLRRGCSRCSQVPPQNGWRCLHARRGEVSRCTAALLHR